MDLSVLEEIGLTKSEIKAYLALLELGSVTTGAIVDKSGVASSKIYEILDKLIKKGLASFIIKSGTKHFEATDPHRILYYVKEKQEKLQKQQEELQKILPELELKKDMSKYKNLATIYKGIKGVQNAFWESLYLLKKGDENLVNAVPKRSEVMNRFFLNFSKERARRGIKEKIIFNKSASGDIQANPKNRPLSEIKFLEQDIITPAAVDVFNDRTLIYPSAKEEFCIVIDSKEVSESFRKQFYMLWDQTNEVYHGWDGLKQAYQEILDNLGKDEVSLVFGATMGEDRKKADEFFRWYNEERKKIGIKLKIIFDQSCKGNYLDEIRMAKSDEIRFLSYPFPSEINIWKDNTMIVGLSNTPKAFMIRDKTITDSFRKYFEHMWGQAKP